MKKLLIAAALACAGCTPSLIPAPGTVADQTVLDEKAAIAVELAYKAARIAVETAVDAGLIKGNTALRVAEADKRAYAAVKAVRTAYRAGNAASYDQAAREATAAVDAILTALKG